MGAEEKLARFDPAHALPGDALGALRAQCAAAAEGLAAGLTAMLRTPVSARLVALDELPPELFLARLERLTCFNVLRAEGLAEPLVLDIHPAILYPLIDRLLGGGREEPLMALRPLTQIELRLAARVTAAVLEAVGPLWEPLGGGPPQVARVETSPDRSAFGESAGNLLSVHYEVGLGPLRGSLQLAMPSALALRLDRQLSGTDPAAPSPSSGGGGPALVTVELTTARLRRAELRELRPGDIITTSKPAGEPLVVLVGGRPKFRAAAGSLRGRKAVRLESLCEPT
jgi:flagellar motor switch protein FliM